MSAPISPFQQLDMSSEGHLEKVYFSAFLHDESDENNNNANADYSTSEKRFIFRNKRSDTIYISCMTIEIEDSAIPDSGLYGAGITLTNGIGLEVQSSDYGTQFILGRDRIKTNTQWAIHATEYPLYNVTGTGPYSVLQKIWFQKLSGFIKLEKNDRFEIYLNDDFTGLSSHRFYVQGFMIQHSSDYNKYNLKYNPGPTIIR